MTHKSSLKVPTPAVVEKTDQHGSEEITNQKRDVGCHGIRYDEADKLLQPKTSRLMYFFMLFADSLQLSRYVCNQTVPIIYALFWPK